ncbi:MAG: hypothetical protein KF850_22995 [Labilithrix sp.]|nr:hypothetical protein [Labilithrix sp.]
MAEFAVRPNEHWFSSIGCVVHRGDERDVFVGGTLIGSFHVGDDGHRNVLLVGLMADKAARVGRLAAAFDLVPETLRVLRKVHEDEGLAAVVARKHGGSDSKVTPKLRARMYAMFAAGLGASAVHGKLRGQLSLRTVSYARAAWRVEHSPASVAETATPADAQLRMPLEAANREAGSASTSVEAGVQGSAEEGDGTERIATRLPLAGRFVQHLGTWLMLASVARLGLHRRADEYRGDRVEEDTLRIALDSVVCALSVGEGCVEGVRRLATRARACSCAPSAPHRRAGHAAYSVASPTRSAPCVCTSA